MKKFFLIVVFFYLTLYANSQNIRNYQFNDFHQYLTEKNNLVSDSFHFSVQEEYFEILNSDSIQNFHEKLLWFNPLYFGNKNILQTEIHKFVNIAPIITSSLSLDKANESLNRDLKAGLNIFGSFTEKFDFNLNFLYANSSFPENFSSKIDSFNIIPHYGKFINKNNENFSYTSLSGYLKYKPAKYICFEAGKGKNFWGHGYRSLLLSDNSNSYPYMKATVDVWRIKYIYMIAKLKDYDSELGNMQNKYSVQHFLSYNLTKWLNFNFFEVVIASPKDAIGANRGFDVNYLNPVVFFRPVEAAVGTADNVLMGIGGSLRLGKFRHFYGQLILDEFVLSHVKARDGWWGNKQGIQAGFKSFKVLFINNLYAQFEINYVRPYTYSHGNSIRNWGNYYQPMAHPLGANFKEAVGILRYNFDNLYLSSKLIYTQYGTNSDSLTVGQDIYRSYNERSKEMGNFTAQGNLNKLIYGELKASYLLVYSWNLFLETSVIFRQHSVNSTKNENIIFTFGLKTFLFNENYDY